MSLAPSAAKDFSVPALRQLKSRGVSTPRELPKTGGDERLPLRFPVVRFGSAEIGAGPTEPRASASAVVVAVDLKVPDCPGVLLLIP